MDRNPANLSGWTFIDKVLLERHPELSDLKVGDTKTVEKEDRYILYLNRGWITVTGNRPLICMYRRFKPFQQKYGPDYSSEFALERKEI